MGPCFVPRGVECPKGPLGWSALGRGGGPDTSGGGGPALKAKRATVEEAFTHLRWEDTPRRQHDVSTTNFTLDIANHSTFEGTLGSWILGVTCESTLFFLQRPLPQTIMEVEHGPAHFLLCQGV